MEQTGNGRSGKELIIFVFQQQSDVTNSKTKPRDFVIDLLPNLLQESSIFKGNDITVY